MKPSSLRFGWLLAALVAFGAAGCANDTSFGQKVDDATISTKVKTALLGAPDVAGTAVQVETLRGQVQLSGFVDSAAEAQRAVDLASRVEGVSRVINKMSVKQK